MYYMHRKAFALCYVLVNCIVFLASFLKDIWYLCHYFALVVYSLHFLYTKMKKKKIEPSDFIAYSSIIRGLSAFRVCVFLT